MPLVLVVEDDSELRNVLRMAIQDEGFEVEVVADGREAIGWVNERRPGLVVLDWGLPDVDGLAVAQHVSAVHGSTVPVLLLTADGRASAKATQIGAYAFLPKPFDLDEMLAAVQRGLTPPHA